MKIKLLINVNEKKIKGILALLLAVIVQHSGQSMEKAQPIDQSENRENNALEMEFKALKGKLTLLMNSLRKLRSQLESPGKEALRRICAENIEKEKKEIFLFLVNLKSARPKNFYDQIIEMACPYVLAINEHMESKKASPKTTETIEEFTSIVLDMFGETNQYKSLIPNDTTKQACAIDDFGAMDKIEDYTFGETNQYKSVIPNDTTKQACAMDKIADYTARLKAGALRSFCKKNAYPLENRLSSINAYVLAPFFKVISDYFEKNTDHSERRGKDDLQKQLFNLMKKQERYEDIPDFTCILAKEIEGWIIFLNDRMESDIFPTSDRGKLATKVFSVPDQYGQLIDDINDLLEVILDIKKTHPYPNYFNEPLLMNCKGEQKRLMGNMVLLLQHRDEIKGEAAIALLLLKIKALLERGSVQSTDFSKTLEKYSNSLKEYEGYALSPIDVLIESGKDNPSHRKAAQLLGYPYSCSLSASIQQEIKSLLSQGSLTALRTFNSSMTNLKKALRKKGYFTQGQLEKIDDLDLLDSLEYDLYEIEKRISGSYKDYGSYIKILGEICQNPMISHIKDNRGIPLSQILKEMQSQTQQLQNLKIEDAFLEHVYKHHKIIYGLEKTKNYAGMVNWKNNSEDKDDLSPIQNAGFDTEKTMKHPIGKISVSVEDTKERLLFMAKDYIKSNGDLSTFQKRFVSFILKINQNRIHERENIIAVLSSDKPPIHSHRDQINDLYALTQTNLSMMNIACNLITSTEGNQQDTKDMKTDPESMMKKLAKENPELVEAQLISTEQLKILSNAYNKLISGPAILE